MFGAYAVFGAYVYIYISTYINNELHSIHHKQKKKHWFLLGTILGTKKARQMSMRNAPLIGPTSTIGYICMFRF